MSTNVSGNKKRKKVPQSLQEDEEGQPLSKQQVLNHNVAATRKTTTTSLTPTRHGRGGSKMRKGTAAAVSTAAAAADDSAMTTPIRRSTRIRVPTLDFWRNERLLSFPTQSPALVTTSDLADLRRRQVTPEKTLPVEKKAVAASPRVNNTNRRHKTKAKGTLKLPPTPTTAQLEDKEEEEEDFLPPTAIRGKFKGFTETVFVDKQQQTHKDEEQEEGDRNDGEASVPPLPDDDEDAQEEMGGNEPYSTATAFFDSSKLRQKYKYDDGQSAILLKQDGMNSEEMNIVAKQSRLKYTDLPTMENRTVAKGAAGIKVKQEVGSRNVGYLMGSLTIPPGGIKDAETVGSSSQTFGIMSGQPGAVEVAYADPTSAQSGSFCPQKAIRFLLGPGDMFAVPPGNMYRLENHSNTMECQIIWTIIHAHVAVEPDGVSEDEGEEEVEGEEEKHDEEDDDDDRAAISMV